MNWQPPGTPGTPPPPPPPGAEERELQDRLDALRADREATASGAADVPPDRQEDVPAFYCPGCGRTYKFQAECTGRSPEAPHAAIEVVPSAELDGDPAGHTPAPGAPG